MRGSHFAVVHEPPPGRGAGEDADWREVASIVPHIDPEKKLGRACRAGVPPRARVDDTNVLRGASCHTLRGAVLMESEGVYCMPHK